MLPGLVSGQVNPGQLRLQAGPLPGRDPDKSGRAPNAAEGPGQHDDPDEQNDGDMARTLETYFSYLGNLARAAGALHLHRNSLSYRLRRIEELLGVSLEDAEACFRIQLALKLHRLAKG